MAAIEIAEAEGLIRLIIERHRSSLATLDERLVQTEDRLGVLVPRHEAAAVQRDRINSEVARLKNERNANHAEARTAAATIREVRERAEEGGIVHPDPRWARDRLEKELVRIESTIETKSLSRDRERTLFKEMRDLIHRHEEWVNERNKKHPEHKTLSNEHEKLRNAHETAQALHEQMVALAKSSEPFHQEMRNLTAELERNRQLHARLLAIRRNSPDALEYWTSALEKGLNDENEIFLGIREFTGIVEEMLVSEEE